MEVLVKDFNLKTDLNNIQKEQKKQKDEIKIKIAESMKNLKEIKNNFTNQSRKLPDRHQKIPNDWVNASYVKQISTYSKKFLRDINDPHLKNKAFLVGKPVYIENNVTFDQQPSIIEHVNPILTGIDVVNRDFPTQEKANLWNKFMQEEFKQNYKDVSFNPNISEALSDFQGVQNIIRGKEVEVELANRYNAEKQQSVFADKILQDTINPIKPVMFTKDNLKQISFQGQKYVNPIPQLHMDPEPAKFRYMKKFDPLQFLISNNFKPVPLPNTLNPLNTNPVINPQYYQNIIFNNSINNISNNNIKKPFFNHISPFQKFLLQTQYLNSINNQNKMRNNNQQNNLGILPQNPVVVPKYLMNTQLYNQFMKNNPINRFKQFQIGNKHNNLKRFQIQQMPIFRFKQMKKNNKRKYKNKKFLKIM